MEPIQLSELQKEDAVIPQRNPLDMVSPSTELEPIIQNTFVEDTVRENPANLLDGTLNERIQRLNDKKNTYTLLNRQYENSENQLIRETAGQGITAIGRRNTLVTNQRVLDAKRRLVLADVEDLRGNIETAESLRRSAASVAPKSYQEKIKAEFIALRKEGGASQEELASLESTPSFTFMTRINNVDTSSIEDQDTLEFIQNVQDNIPEAVSLASGFFSGSSSSTTGGSSPQEIANSMLAETGVVAPSVVQSNSTIDTSSKRKRNKGNSVAPRTGVLPSGITYEIIQD